MLKWDFEYGVGEGGSAPEEMETLDWVGCFNGIRWSFKEQLWEAPGWLRWLNL